MWGTSKLFVVAVKVPDASSCILTVELPLVDHSNLLAESLYRNLPLKSEFTLVKSMYALFPDVHAMSMLASPFEL